MNTNVFSLNDQVALITGGGTGIGRGITQALLEAGATVVITGRREAVLQEAAESLGDRCHYQVSDVTNKTELPSLVQTIEDQHGPIDILVNNAGKATQGKITELSADDWRSAIDVNLNGTFYVSQAAMPHLITSKGNIVNISSLSGVGGDWNMAAYNAAKAGVTNLTRTLALDHGSDGVRVNAVNPSVTKTDMTTAIQDNESKTDKFLARCPLGRLATPEDIAAAITFLASDDASMITGVNLPVDGGVSASNGQPQF